MPPAKQVSSYSCVYARKQCCPLSRTVLFVPSDKAQQVFELLDDAKLSLYAEWELDTTKLSATVVDALPECLGHVVTVPEEGDLPEKEHHLLQLLINGKYDEDSPDMAESTQLMAIHQQSMKWSSRMSK